MIRPDNTGSLRKKIKLLSEQNDTLAAQVGGLESGNDLEARADIAELQAAELALGNQHKLTIENLLYHDLYVPRSTKYTVVDTGDGIRHLNSGTIDIYQYMVNTSAENRFLAGHKYYYRLRYYINTMENAVNLAFGVGFNATTESLVPSQCRQ